MSSVENFCSNLIHDTSQVFSNTGEPPKAREERITSLITRVAGLFAAILSATSFFSFTAVGFICSVGLLILAHDLIVTGNNVSNMINSITDLGRRGVLNAATTVVGGVIQESRTNLPYSLQNTWIFSSLYRTFLTQ